MKFSDHTANELLRIALSESEDGVARWRQLNSCTPIENHPSVRLLYPAIHHNIATSLTESDHFPQLEIAYIQTLYDNLTLLQNTQNVLERMRLCGISTVVLKGMAMLDFYDDVGLRFMGDCDILVEPQQVGDAAKVLIEDGWRFEWGLSPACFINEVVANQHSFGMHRGDIHLDLHWHALHQDLSQNSEQLTFQHAVERDFLNYNITRPCATDLFFHAVIHGLRERPHKLTWVMDLHHLIQNKFEPLDWDYLQFRVHKQHFQEIFATALPSLNAEFGFKFSQKNIARFSSFWKRPLQRRELVISSPLVDAPLRHKQFAVEVIREIRRLSSYFAPWPKLLTNRLRSLLATPINRSPYVDIILIQLRRDLRVKKILENIAPNYLYARCNTSFPIFHVEPNQNYDFGELGSGTAMTISGWSNPETSIIWSHDNQPVLQMIVLDGSDYRLKMDVEIYIPPGVESTTIDIVINRQTKQRLQVTRGETRMDIDVFLKCFDIENCIDIRFDISLPSRPVNYGLTDTRALGICLYSLQIMTDSTANLSV